MDNDQASGRPKLDDERFPGELRLRSSAEFQRVFQRRRSAADGVLIVHGCDNDLARTRLGLSVSRKVGGAVVRNRWKRLIREAFRRQQPQLPAGVDLVVIPRREFRPTAAAVADSLVRLATRVAGRIRTEKESGKKTTD